MRVVKVWVSALVFMFVITVSWWITMPVVLAFINAVSSSITVSEGIMLMNAVGYVAVLWGPLLDLFILVWAFMESQRRDVESEIYY